MKLITTGYTRTVLLVGRWAIKVPALHTCCFTGYQWKRFKAGWASNHLERSVSKAGAPEVCPVVFSFLWGLVIVMPRLKILTFDEWCAADLHTAEAEAFYADNKPENFGWYQGRPVLLDYGVPW